MRSMPLQNDFFLSICYVHVEVAKRSTLDDKTEIRTFQDYVASSIAYKLYNLKSK